MEAGESPTPAAVRAPARGRAGLTGLLPQAEVEQKIDLRLQPALQTLGEHRRGDPGSTVQARGTKPATLSGPPWAGASGPLRP